MNRQKPNKKTGFNNFIRYSSLGFEMMAIIGLLTFLGFKTDQWMETEFHFFTLGFMVVSVVIAIVYAIGNFLKK